MKNNGLFVIVDCLGRIFSFVPYKVWEHMSGLLNRVYTGYMRSSFKYFGHSILKRHLFSPVGLQYVSVGDGCTIEKGVQLEAHHVLSSQPVLKIGNDCIIRKDSHITAINSIVIGDGLLTGTNVLITDNSHGLTDAEALSLPPKDRIVVSKGPVVIGKNVWLGNNVVVLPGVRIGDGAVVGANSVVCHNVDDYCVVAGVPVKLIKTVKV